MGPEGRWELKDDFSYLMRIRGGSHQWKGGVDFSYIPFEGDNTGSPLGSWTFPKDAPYDPNDRTTWPTQYTNSLPTYADIPVKVFAAYVQDDWQAAPGLTFNLGLRYDIQFGSFNEDVQGLLANIQDKLGRDGTFPFDVSIFPQPRSTRGDRNNFGPRVGVAWDPANNGVTNVHAAYGLFYDNMRTLQNFGELTWPQAKAITILTPSFPDPFGGRSRESFLSTTPPTVTVGSNGQINMYAHQTNVGLSQRLTSDIAVTVDVTSVMRYGDRDTVEINLPNQTTRVRPYPTFVRVNFWQPTADNFYKALLVKVEKRMTNHYQALASYTLAKADDDNVIGTRQDVYGYSKVRRAGTADRRHRLVVSGIVALPLDMQVSAIGDFRSSLPFSPSSSAGDLNNDTITGDLPPGVLPGSGCRDLESRRHQRVPHRPESHAGQRGRLSDLRQHRSAVLEVLPPGRQARRIDRPVVQHLRSRELRGAKRQHRRRQRSGERPPVVRHHQRVARQHQRTVAAGGVRGAVPVLASRKCNHEATKSRSRLFFFVSSCFRGCLCSWVINEALRGRDVCCPPHRRGRTHAECAGAGRAGRLLQARRRVPGPQQRRRRRLRQRAAGAVAAGHGRRACGGGGHRGAAGV
jgi:hypothetical protein